MQSGTYTPCASGASNDSGINSLISVDSFCIEK